MCVSITHAVIKVKGGKVFIAAEGDGEREVSLALLEPGTMINVGDGVQCRDGYVVKHLTGEKLRAARRLNAAMQQVVRDEATHHTHSLFAT